MVVVALLLVSLGFDTLAVAIGLGLSGLARDRWLRIGVVFALCEGLMPIVGLIAGRNLTTGLGSLAQYVAAGLLVIIGAKAVREALSEDDDAPKSLLEGKSLLMAGLSVSLDELAIGFSLGSFGVRIGPTVVFIAMQAFAITLLGLSLGQRLGKRLEARAELVSGGILLVLGVVMVINQLAGTRGFHYAP